MPTPLTIRVKDLSILPEINGFEFRKAFASLLVNGIIFKNQNNAAIDCTNLLASVGFGLKITPESLAGVLIEKSWIRAMEAIIKAHSRELEQLIRTEQSELVDIILSQNPIDINGIEIDQEFFNRPEDWEYLHTIKAWIELKLQDLGVDCEKARSMSAELPGCFATALNDELGDQDKYKPLTKYFADTLCSEADHRAENWRLYRARLNEQLDDPIFAEKFGIRELYVPLSAYYK
jgi:hypothetical protein